MSIQNCKCGFIQEKNDYSEKRAKCSETTALLNHVTFPCMELVINVFKPSKIYMKPNLDASMFTENLYLPTCHWALIMEITEDKNYRDFKLEGFNTFNEKLTFQLMNIENSDPTTFRVNDIKKGNTAVCLYAYKYEENFTDIKTAGKNLDHLYIFKAPLKILLEEGYKILNDWDSREMNQMPVCFECGQTSETLSRCTVCKLAKYCSKHCQVNSWKKCHKYLCSQMEVLLRLACLPRHLKFNNHFTFKLGHKSALPEYTFNAKFTQKVLPKSITSDSNNNTDLKILKETTNDLNKDSKKCGLCKKTDTESLVANQKPLTKTKCCENWICDDSHKYVVNSFSKISCWRNHERFTICGRHYRDEHIGKWQTCKQCRLNNKNDIFAYIDFSKNEFNFEPNKQLDRISIQCSGCGFSESELKYFSGRVMISPCDYKFYCKKKKCKEIGFPGGYPYHETAFINHTISNRKQLLLH